MKNFNEYKNEISNKYSNTKEYKEFINKHNNNLETKQEQLMMIIKEIGLNKDLKIESDDVQSLIKKLHEFITNNYYTCSKEMLMNLGQMYVDDIRFKNNIDKTAGDGTSEYINQAIKIYCK